MEAGALSETVPILIVQQISSTERLVNDHMQSQKVIQPSCDALESKLRDWPRTHAKQDPELRARCNAIVEMRLIVMKGPAEASSLAHLHA